MHCALFTEKINKGKHIFQPSPLVNDNIFHALEYNRQDKTEIYGFIADTHEQ